MHVELIARGDKYQREMKRAQDRAKGLSSDLVSLGGVVRRIAGVFGAFKLVDFAKDATLAAARYETLGVVTEVVGRNAGYSASQMAAFEQGLRSTGIAAVESRETLARMVQAQVDLSHSTDLARVAQDAAVIANTNSSDAFNRLVYGIQSAQVETLRTMGLNVNFETSYARLAKQLGKNAQDLTELEKTQARVNVVLQAGEQIHGTYEASMETAGKQLGSMKRLVDDLMVSLGSAALPEFTRQVFAASDGLKGIQDNIEPVVQTLRIFTSMAVATFRTAANTVQLLFGTVANAIISVAEFAVRGLEMVIELANKIPGVNLKAAVSSEELRLVSSRIAAAMGRDIAQIGDAWNDVLLTINDVTAAQYALRFQPDIPDKEPLNPDAPQKYAASLAGLNAQLHAIVVGPINPMTGALITLDEMMARSRAAEWAQTLADANVVIEEVQTPLEMYAERMSFLNDLYEQGAISQEVYARATENAAAAFNQFTEAERIVQQLTDAGVRLAGAFASTLVDATTDGIAAFKRFGAFVLQTLGDIAAKFAIFKALSFLFPGSGFVGALGQSFGFAGAFADGGHIPQGQWGIVGERGPEVVQGPANVTPMSQVGGVTEFVFPAPSSSFERLAQDYLAEGLRKLEHSGFRVRTT